MSREDYIKRISGDLASGKIAPDRIEERLHNLWDTAESEYTRRQAAQEAVPEQKMASTLGAGTVPKAPKAKKLIRGKPGVYQIPTDNSVSPSAAAATPPSSFISASGTPKAPQKEAPKPAARLDVKSFAKKAAPHAVGALGDIFQNMGQMTGINMPRDSYDPLQSVGKRMSEYAEDAEFNDPNSGVVAQANDMLSQLGLENAPEYKRMDLLMRIIEQKNAALAYKRLRRRGY